MADASSRLKRNYIYNLAYQILQILVPLITTPYISRVLGAEKIGEYSYTAAIVSYFGIAAVLGTVVYGQREIAIVQNDESKRSRLFYELFLLRLICVLIVAVAYIGFILITPRYKILYIIQFMTVASWALDISWFFQGMENFKVTVLRNAVVKILSVVLILLLVRDQNDLYVYTAIVTGVTMVGYITLWPYLKSYIVKISLSEIHPQKHLKESIELFIPVIAIQIYTVLDQTMIGLLTTMSEVGFYVQSQKIVKLASCILYALTAVLLPRLSAVLAENDYKEATNLYNRVVSFTVMLVMPLMFGLFTIASTLVPVFFGSGYDECVPILWVFSFFFITQGVGQLFGTILLGMKRQKQYTISVTAGAVFNLCCNYLLIGRLGAVGASIASVFAELLVELLMLYFIQPEFNGKILIRSILHYLPPAFVMGIVVVLLTNFMPGSQIIVLAVSIIAGVLVYGGWLIAAGDEMLTMLPGKLSRLARKN